MEISSIRKTLHLERTVLRRVVRRLEVILVTIDRSVSNSCISIVPSMFVGEALWMVKSCMKSNLRGSVEGERIEEPDREKECRDSRSVISHIKATTRVEKTNVYLPNSYSEDAYCTASLFVTPYTRP